MNKPKPIFLIEYPEYTSTDRVSDIINDFSEKLEGYHIIATPKDIEHINFKFN
jgi:hypothetical protein